jgi:hypothetical protein
MSSNWNKLVRQTHRWMSMDVMVDSTNCWFLLTASKPSALQSLHAAKSHPWIRNQP